MIPDPRTTQLIHDTMIQEELERYGPAHLRRTRQPFPRSNPLRPVRGIAARAVWALASRIEPAPQDGCIPTSRESVAM